jgi:hypothetical protein
MVLEGRYAAAFSRGSTIWWQPGQYVFCRADRKLSSQLGQMTTRRFKASLPIRLV